MLRSPDGDNDMNHLRLHTIFYVSFCLKYPIAAFIGGWQINHGSQMIINIEKYKKMPWFYNFSHAIFFLQRYN